LTGFPEVFTVDILGQGKYTIPLEEFWVSPSEKTTQVTFLISRQFWITSTRPNQVISK